MIRLWNRLLKLKGSRLTKRIFDYDYNRSSIVNNWCSQVKNILTDFNQIDKFQNKEQCNLLELEKHLLEKQKREREVI